MKKLLAPMLILLLSTLSHAAEVPKSPYITIAYRYADALIKTSRDMHAYGQNDLRILYTLGELSNKPVYRDAADAELKWLLQNPARITDGPRPWMLWDRCFELSPDQTRTVALKASSMRTFAAAYVHTKDDTFLKLIDAALNDTPKVKASPIQQLSLAVDSWGAAARVPEPLATKLRRFAEAQDEAFLSRQPARATDLWQNAANHPGTLAMLYVSRYENTGNTKFRDLIHSAADAYRSNPPPTDADISPMTFGHVISLELAAWRSAAKQEYLDSARNLADIAVKKYWTDNDPLPRADSSTNPDTLVLSILELHLSILHITAVRCPPNTIDR